MAIGRFTLRKKAASKSDISLGVASAIAEKELPKPRVTTDAGLLSVSQRLLEAKLRIHRRLIDEINLSAVEHLSEKEMRPQIHELVAEHVISEKIILNADELEQFVDDILNEMLGLGPIEPLLKDDSVDDILINTRTKFPKKSNFCTLSTNKF